MEKIRFRLVTAVLALSAGAAVAQDVGFFRPAVDPALTTPYMRPQPPQAPQPPAPPGNAASETAPTAAAELAATRQEDAMQWAEQQMDRAQTEAQHAREQSQPQPAGVGAAFSGSTSERDR